MESSGHLALSEGEDHTVEEWEAAAAAVLRKAGRLAEDDADDAVWDKLARRTLDGIAVSPLGTPKLVADLPEPVRPPARGEGWDVRAAVSDPDPKRRARRRDDRPRERRDVAARAGRRRGSRGRRPGRRARGRAARRRARRARGALGPRSARPARSPSSPAVRRSLPARTSGWTRSGALVRESRFRQARPAVAQTSSRTRPRSPRNSGVARWWSTGRRCTTSAPPTCRSSATRWPSGPTTSASWRPPASTSTRPMP